MIPDPTVVPPPDLTYQIGRLNDLLGQLVQFTGHVGTGAMSAHIIQWLKTRPALGKLWKDLSDRGKVIAGAVAAAIPAAGITFTFLHPEANSYGFLLSNLTWATTGKFIWSLSQNWVFQQGWYQSVIKARPVSGTPLELGVPQPPPVKVAVAGSGN